MICPTLKESELIKCLIILAVVFTVLISASTAFAESSMIMQGHIKTVDQFSPNSGNHSYRHFFYPENSESVYPLNFDNMVTDWYDTKGKLVKIIGFQPQASGSAELPLYVTEMYPVNSYRNIASSSPQPTVPPSIKSVTLLSQFSDVTGTIQK